MKRFVMLGVAAAIVSGCAVVPENSGRKLPQSLGEQYASFGYVPLDGLAVDQTYGADSCQEQIQAGTPGPRHRELLQSLPDFSVRFAVADFDANGALSFGPAKVTTKGGTYRAVLDYINVDTIAVDFLVRKRLRKKAADGSTETSDWVKFTRPIADDEEVAAYEAKLLVAVGESAADIEENKREMAKREEADHFERVTIPVYVGIGMRLSADIRALESGITLSSLGAIGAEAQANGLSGTLTVQTLGISGRRIATALPLPSKLDQTTVENAILALGSSRAVLYSRSEENEEIMRTPRVVGLYNPVGSEPLLVNALYSALASSRQPWHRPCGDATNEIQRAALSTNG